MPLPVSAIHPPTGWQEIDADAPYSRQFTDQFRRINSEPDVTIRLRAVARPDRGRAGASLAGFGLQLHELTGEWLAPLQADETSVDGRQWWTLRATHPAGGERTVAMTTQHGFVVLVLVAEGPIGDGIRDWLAAGVWEWADAPVDPATPDPAAPDAGPGHPGHPDATPTPGGRHGRHPAGSEVLGPDGPQHPEWYQPGEPLTEDSPANRDFNRRQIRAAVGSSTAHDLLSVLYIPTWESPAIPDGGTFRAGLRYGLSVNGSDAVDANYSEVLLDLRCAIFDRLEVALGFGIGMWDGSVSPPNVSTDRQGGTSILDLLLGIRVGVMKTDDGMPIDLTMALVVKFPTGSAEDFLGTERPDYGYTVNAQVPLGGFTLLAQASAVFVGSASEIALPATTLLAVGVGGGYTFDDVVSTSLTFDAVFTDGAYPVFSLGLGVRTAPIDSGVPIYPELAAALGLSDTAADFSIQLGVSFLFR